MITSVDAVSGGSVYVSGITLTSTADATTCATPTSGGFPTCANSLDYSQGYTSPGDDAFILKFKNHNLVWGTFLGGSGSDGFSSVTAASPVITHDASDNIYMATASASPYNSTASPAPTQYNSGINFNQSNSLDAIAGNYNSFEVLFYAFTPYNQILWGSYFGGTGASYIPQETGELPTSIDCFGNSLIITGHLHTTNAFPVTPLIPSISYLQGTTTVSTNPAEGDAFISEFDISQIPNAIHDNIVITNNITLFPNPVTDETFSLIINIQTNEKFSMRIYDLCGKLIYEHPEPLGSQKTVLVSLPSFSNGMYFIKLENQTGECLTEKFIINR